MFDYRAEYRELYKLFPTAPASFENIIRALYLQCLSPGDVAIDCGAHIGKHTIPMSKVVGANGRVLAFEPIPEKFERLQRQVESEHCTNVLLKNALVGSEVKPSVKFNYVPADPGKSAIILRHGLEALEKKVFFLQQTTIDAECDRKSRCKFIKIDVEGAEFDVLEGSHITLAEGRPVVHFECGESVLKLYGHTPDRIYEFLKSFEYEVYDVLGNHLADLENFLSSMRAGGIYDFLALPEWLNADVVAGLAAKEFIR